MPESFDVVQYLDKKYPSSPCVVTAGTLAFETGYCTYFLTNVQFKRPRSIYLHLHEIITPESAAFVQELREALGDTPEDPVKNPSSVVSRVCGSTPRRGIAAHGLS